MEMNDNILNSVERHADFEIVWIEFIYNDWNDYRI